jgi:glutamyl-tRNA(Gln) amidotransferase subunit D
MHSSRRDAFRPINVASMGYVRDGKVDLSSALRGRGKGKVTVNDRFDEKVALVWFYPGLKVEMLEQIVDQHNGVVVAGTGLGHVATELIEVVKKATGAGKPVVITTQCLYGTVDLEVYSTGRALINAGAIPGGDMLPETALVKLMWILGMTNDMNEIRDLVQRNVIGELGTRRTVDSYPSSGPGGPEG